MSKNVLVLGATGLIGKVVAEKLLKDGFHVRVLARNPSRAKDKLGNGFEYVEGDVTNFPSVVNAMESCNSVFISLNSKTLKELKEVELEGGMNVIRAAAEQKLDRVVLISGAGVKKENTRYPLVKVKYQLEQALMKSGCPYTIFAPTHFMDSLYRYVQSDKAMIIGNQPHKIRWLAASDFAKMVSRSMTLKEAENKRFLVFGPQPYTMEEALMKYCRAKCPNVSLTHTPAGALAFMATITLNPKLRYIALLMKYFSHRPESGSAGEAEKLFGKPFLTLEKWLEG